MKSIDAIYKFGNLYDRQSRKRIFLEDGSDISLVVNIENILAEDPNLKPDKLLTSIEKEAEVKKAQINYWKLFPAGVHLFFEISAGVKRKNETEPIRCTFRLKLLEDLYIYNNKSEPKYARFFDCHCQVEECMANFDFFELIYAKSLNDAYTKTYELYFAMFGKSTCNAFDRFYETSELKEPIRGKTESIQK